MSPHLQTGISSWKTSSTFAGLLLCAWYVGLTSALIGAVAGTFLYLGALRDASPRALGVPVDSPAGGQPRSALPQCVEKNFGLSSPRWDHVFGSYLRHVALEPDEENERQV